jgi:NAD+ synthase
MISVKICKTSTEHPTERGILTVNAPLVVNWLVKFLQYECIHRRSIHKAVLGLSGGVDSAVVAYLCTRAFGPENVFAFCMPYKVSSRESIEHAQLVINDLGIHSRVIDITEMVDSYASLYEENLSPSRLGNVCARARMVILFDQSAKLHALPIGTGNKSERLLGYYTWHADDSPPINPLGDLFKTQVWQIARELKVPSVIVDKPASADLIRGQTDEADFGFSYKVADIILHYVVLGYSTRMIMDMGLAEKDIEQVIAKVKETHWKRRLPTVAILSSSAIGESYLRPVDY